MHHFVIHFTHHFVIHYERGVHMNKKDLSYKLDSEKKNRLMISVPKWLDKLIREKAKESGLSISYVACDALEKQFRHEVEQEEIENII